MAGHIGDVCAISSTCTRNYLQVPGLHRTLLGDGLATSLASLFGALTDTTYGENAGVFALSKVLTPGSSALWRWFPPWARLWASSSTQFSPARTTIV